MILLVVKGNLIIINIKQQHIINHVQRQGLVKKRDFVYFTHQYIFLCKIDLKNLASFKCTKYILVSKIDRTPNPKKIQTRLND